MGDTRASSREQISTELVLPSIGAAQQKVCEDCGRVWIVECDNVDINLCIHIQDFKDCESPPLCLTVLREAAEPLHKSPSLESPARLTCVVVGPQDKYAYKWKVNHKGRGSAAYSGCQIKPILWRGDCTTKDLQDSGSSGGSIRIINPLDNDISSNSRAANILRTDGKETHTQVSTNSTSYNVVTNLLGTEKSIYDTNIGTKESTSISSFGTNIDINQVLLVEKERSYKACDRTAVENTTNYVNIEETIKSELGNNENKKLSESSNKSDNSQNEIVMVEMKEECLMEKSPESFEATEQLYTDPLDAAAAWTPETTTKGTKCSGSPGGKLQSTKMVSEKPEHPDPVREFPNPTESSSNTMDLYQYTVQLNPDLSPSTKRFRQEHTWRRNVAKTKRNLGMEYVSQRTQKIVTARQIGPPCTCDKACYKRVGTDMIQELFTNYWNLGDWNLQTAYLQQHTTSSEIKRKNLNDRNKYRTCSVNYFVEVSNRSKTLKVCKQGFCNLHGISKSRVDRALRTAIADQRGKHSSRSTQIEETRINLAVNHMSSVAKLTTNLPSVSSVNVSSQEQCVRNRRHMYDIYKAWLQECHATEEPVSLRYYLDTLRRTFPNMNFPVYGNEIKCFYSLKPEKIIENDQQTYFDPVQHCVVNIQES